MATFQSTRCILVLPAVASACILTACGGDGSTSAGTSTGQGQGQGTQSIAGVVATSGFIPGSATEPTLKPGYYQGALVCADANENGKCESAENPATTDAHGAFKLNVSGPTSLIADIGTSAVNTGTRAPVTSRMVLRASLDQVNEQIGGGVVISPLSSEVERLVEANGTSYAIEKANLAQRLDVGIDAVLADIGSASGTAAAPWMRTPEALRAFPMAARVIEGAGTMQLREGFHLTTDGWAPNDDLS